MDVVPRWTTLILLAAALAAPIHAFEGDEHEALTTLALAVALESLEPALEDSLEADLRAKFLDCSPRAELRLQACRCASQPAHAGCPSESGVCIPFGRLNRAVDKVIRPEGLIPTDRIHGSGAVFQIKAPERCDEGKRPFSPSMAAIIAAQDPGALFPVTACRAERKLDQVRYWLLAVHQNASHFEACAAERYNALHGLAVELARDAAMGAGELWVALVAEAVALHFLQDSLAPGHLLTPRAGATDILARGLHNGYNRRGAPVHFDATSLPGLQAALDATLAEEGPPVVRRAIETLSIEGDDLLPAVCRLSQPRAPCYFGDGKLRETTQARQLVLLSAASIRDVLSAAIEKPRSEPAKPPILRISFEDWSAEATSAGRPDRRTLLRPCLSYGQGEARDDCAPSPGVLFGFFQQPALDKDRFSMSLRNLEFSVAYLFGDSTQRHGLRAEVGLPFGGPNDGDIRRRHANPSGAAVHDDGPSPFENRLGTPDRGLPVTWTLQWETWPEYEARGFTVRPWFVAKRHYGWDMMWSLETGWKWYSSDMRNTDRVTWGSHVAIGYGVVFLDLGWERGSLLTAEGEHKRNSNYSLGFRFQLP